MNIELMTLSKVSNVEGDPGNFLVEVTRRPRYVDMDKCIACGLCAEKCPAKAVDEYNEGLGTRKAAYLPYPQAVPLKYAIDPEQCIYLLKGKCKACEKFCPAGAINFEDTEKRETVQVGALILAGGLRAFDPNGLANYRYADLPNVVTSTAFERLLSSSGPHAGHIIRLSDEADARRIAWLQCIGSRDINQSDNPYCSSVCCMYAIKQALMAKEHIGESFQGTVFHMDMRTHGKDFERYYNRAGDQGIRFIRSRPHSVNQTDPSGTVSITYADESGRSVEGAFDLVVLSVGMEPDGSAVELARSLGIERTREGFLYTDDFAPVTTSRPGIYVAGVLADCKDIPQSVTEAGAAACASAVKLASARGQRTREKHFPEERDVGSETPRVGVFVCNCGSNIGGFADVPAIVAYAGSLPGVVYTEENLFTCSQDTQERLAEVIRDQGLNRVVVAACTPKTHEGLFQETLREAGLNEHLVEMANIRNQCTWVHSGDREAATEKCKDLVRMSVAKAALLDPIPENQVQIEQSALVIGGGVAGMTAALNVADQGHDVTLVEKMPELGGAARDIRTTWTGKDVQAELQELIRRITYHPRVEVLLNAQVTDTSGFVGNFETVVDVSGKSQSVRHGVTIIATGARASDTDEYLYGRSPRVTRWHELEADGTRLQAAGTVVFILCVGSRDENRPYCSRICCTASIKQAIELKEDDPGKEVYILYRDIRTYGRREALYREAREKGVIFIRYTPERKPTVTELESGLEIRVFDPVLEREILIQADLLNLATAIEPVENHELVSRFKLPVDDDGFFTEAHAKLRPVDFVNDGMFLCGMAQYPKPIDEAISQSMAAASRAAGILSRTSIKVSPLVSQVDRDRCVGCGLCAELCRFGAITMEEVEGLGYRAVNIAASCKGCGLCAASCPQKAIDMLHFRDRQILAAVGAALS